MEATKELEQPSQDYSELVSRLTSVDKIHKVTEEKKD